MRQRLGLSERLVDGVERRPTTGVRLKHPESALDELTGAFRRVQRATQTMKRRQLFLCLQPGPARRSVLKRPLKVFHGGRQVSPVEGELPEPQVGARRRLVLEERRLKALPSTLYIAEPGTPQLRAQRAQGCPLHRVGRSGEACLEQTQQALKVGHARAHLEQRAPSIDALRCRRSRAEQRLLMMRRCVPGRRHWLERGREFEWQGAL